MSNRACVFSVRTGGWLLTFFLQNFGSKLIRRKLKNAIKEKAADDVYIEQAIEEELVHVVRVEFYTWLIQACAVRGNAATKQLFYLSLLLQFRGLSRIGLQLMSCFNLALPPTTFDRLKSIELDRITVQVRSVREL